MKHQKQFIVKMLLKDGQVSRNTCLQNYVSRLGAIICQLQKEGWSFEAGYEPKGMGKDYIYKTIRCPFKKVEFINPITKETIIKYEKN
jgi:hypothetical protein